MRNEENSVQGEPAFVLGSMPIPASAQPLVDKMLALAAQAKSPTPNPSPQDLDVLAAESESLEAAGIPWEWRDALRRTLTPGNHFGAEEGHPCPGGYGA